MNYATGCAFNLDEIMMNLNMSKLKFNGNDAIKINGEPHRKVVAKKVFKEALKIILNDIIDNNVTFELPTGGRPASIYIKRTQGDNFINARKNGKWRDVDFLQSNFSGNQMVFSMKTDNIIKEKPIYLDSKLKNKITDNTNKGKQYC